MWKPALLSLLLVASPSVAFAARTPPRHAAPAKKAAPSVRRSTGTPKEKQLSKVTRISHVKQEKEQKQVKQEKQKKQVMQEKQVMQAKKEKEVRGTAPVEVASRPALPPAMIVRHAAPAPAADRAAEADASKSRAHGRIVLGHDKARRFSTPAVRVPHFPSVLLHEANLGEDLAFRPFDERGRPRAAAAKDFDRFMRDHHTGRRRHIDPRLAKWLYEVARHFGRRVEVFSGYRPREFSARKHSRHITGHAVDFRIPGVPNEAIIKYLRATFHPSGVGYYPNGVHVHLDVDRDHDTYWVDTGDAPSPAPTDRDADEATSDETVAAPPSPILDPGAEAVVPDEMPDDDPGLIP